MLHRMQYMCAVLRRFSRKTEVAALQPQKLFHFET